MTAALAACLVLGACSAVTRDQLGDPHVDAFYSAVVQSPYGAVATSTYDAAQAGADVLAAGGNAVDAAVATALALGVADPGDSGLGGQTLMVIRFADGRATAIDGSALVPLHVELEALRPDPNVKGSKWFTSPAFAAVPRSLAALDLAASKYGTRPLVALVQPAIDIAERGHSLTPFQVYSLGKYRKNMLRSEPFRFFFYRNGTEVPPVGADMCWPELARTYRRIAAGGAAEFYAGSIADEIEADMIATGGFLRKADLIHARAHEVPVLRGTYRGLDVLTFPAPGGGEQVIEALNLLETFAPEQLVGHSVDRLQIMGEVAHVAQLDSRTFGRRATVAGRLRPTAHLQKTFARQRAQLISSGRPVSTDELPALKSDYRETDNQTVQVSVTDRWGNAVSLTQTLGRFYGSKAITPSLGFPYNDLLGGLDPDVPSTARPRSSLPSDLSPTIVARDGLPYLVVGTPGSSKIPSIVASVISNVVDRGMSLRDALYAPRVTWDGDGDTQGLCVEVFPPVEDTDIAALRARGYDELITATLPGPQSSLASFGGVAAILFDPATAMYTAVGDPRRNAAAVAVPW